LQLDVHDPVADLARLADIDVLHDVAGLRIDRDGPARAVRILVVRQNLHRLFRADLAFLFADRVENRVHCIVCPDRDETGRHGLAVVAFPRGDEGLVRGAVAGHRVVPGRDVADRCIPHVDELFLGDGVAGAYERYAGLAQPEVAVRFLDGGRSRTR